MESSEVKLMKSQISTLLSSLSELQEANKEVVQKVASECENEGRSEEFRRRTREIHERIVALEKKDNERVQAINVLEKKVLDIGIKVEQVCLLLENQNSKSVPITIKHTKPESKSNNENEDTKSKEDSIQNNTTERAEGPKTKLTEKLLETELSNVKRPCVPQNKLGLRNKSTNFSDDNRVRLLSGEPCIRGTAMERATVKYRTPLTDDTPQKNNLPTRREVLAKRKFGRLTKTAARRRIKQNKNEFKNLAGLLRDPDEVPDIRDMNSWRHMAEAERQKGLYTEVQRGKGPDTCLLLDISASMEGEAFEEMIKTAKYYVKAIQEIAGVLSINENIGIATFGHYTGVVQHMTNDYQKVQNTIDMLSSGGSSPMSGGLYMALACCLGNPGALPTRMNKIILFSDGKATSDIVLHPDDDDPPSGVNDQLQIHMTISETSRDIAMRNLRIYCYPIGCDNDVHMKAISASSNGKIYKGDDIHKLIRMTQSMGIALNIKEHVSLDDADESMIAAIKGGLRGVGPGDADTEDIMDLSKFLSEKDSSGENKHAESNDPDLLPLGSRVRRGPDWDWGNQDAEGPGTVVGHSEGQLWVKWDRNNHVNIYKYHQAFGYDVLPVEEPRILKDELIAVGCLVQRGKDWRYKNQDGGPGNVGVVLRVQKDGRVAVRWPDKSKAFYKFGKGGFFELKICDPLTVYGKPGSLKTHVWGSGNQLGDGNEVESSSTEEHQALDSKSISDTILPRSTVPTAVSQSDTKSPEIYHLTTIEDMNKKNARKVSVSATWFYQKDDNWKPYPDDVNNKIEKAFQRHSQRCIVDIDGDVFQLKFSNWKQVCDKTGEITSIKREENNEEVEK